MKVQKLLLLPLLVMVLLMTLVGFTAFEQMQQLSEAFEGINTLIAQETLVRDLQQNFTREEVINNLKLLQNNALQTIRIVLLCMVVLGIFLAIFTLIELERLFQKLAHSKTLNIQLQEDERRRIAQELHDGVVQALVDLKRHYTSAKVDAVIEQLRRVCHNLKPQILEDLGLAAAIEFLCGELREQGIQVNYQGYTEALSEIPPAYELTLFRIIQELCSNIKNHAKAKKAGIIIHPITLNRFWLEVWDDGIGFTQTNIPPEHMGLTGIQERVSQLNGQFKIKSEPGQGSRFEIQIPLRRKPNESA